MRKILIYITISIALVIGFFSISGLKEEEVNIESRGVEIAKKLHNLQDRFVKDEKDLENISYIDSKSENAIKNEIDFIKKEFDNIDNEEKVVTIERALDKLELALQDQFYIIKHEDFSLKFQQLDELKEQRILNLLGPPNAKNMLISLERARYNEKIIVLDVLQYLSEYADRDNFMVAFLQGGYIIFGDNGHLYNKWKNLGAVSRKGTSSHKSVDEQFAIRGPFVKEALFGTIIINDKIHTWIQLESHQVGIKQLPRHLFSYVIYKITGKNVGPYGRSIYREANPLNLSK